MKTGAIFSFLLFQDKQGVVHKMTEAEVLEYIKHSTITPPFSFIFEMDEKALRRERYLLRFRRRGKRLIRQRRMKQNYESREVKKILLQAIDPASGA